jgi:hypothetical protein
MINSTILATAKGEVPAAEGVTGNVQCTVSEDKDSYLIRIPKRIPGELLTPTQDKERKDGTKVPGSYVYAKLQFPQIAVTAFGKDEGGKDYEIKFMSKPVNNFNQFYKIR